MTLMQIIIILAGLFIGYRLVSYMLAPGTGDADERPASGSGEAADEEREPLRPWTWHDTSTPPPASAPTWYQTLGVAESASREEIDRAYRLQISQHHPDKVATLGEDIRRLAEARTKEINAAYEAAVRQGR